MGHIDLGITKSEFVAKTQFLFVVARVTFLNELIVKVHLETFRLSTDDNLQEE